MIGSRKVERLIDVLRMNLLYQSPRAELQDGEPVAIHVRFLPQAYVEIMSLIRQAGGWDLTAEQRIDVYQRHEAAARAAMGDGIDYDLSKLSYGDLAMMWSELDGIGELPENLVRFRDAIGSELERQRVGPT